MRWGGVGALVMGGGWEGWGVRGGEGAGLARLKRRVFLDSELQTRAGAVWPEGVELCRAWNCSVPFFLCVVRCVSHVPEHRSLSGVCVARTQPQWPHRTAQRQTETHRSHSPSDRIMVSGFVYYLRAVQSCRSTKRAVVVNGLVLQLYYYTTRILRNAAIR